MKVRKKPKGEMETSVHIMDFSYVGHWHGKDADLKHLQALSNLTELQVISKRVTDAGMAHIGAVKTIRVLRLAAPKVTDEGLGQLTALTWKSCRSSTCRLQLRQSRNSSSAS